MPNNFFEKDGDTVMQDFDRMDFSNANFLKTKQTWGIKTIVQNTLKVLGIIPRILSGHVREAARKHNENLMKYGYPPLRGIW